MWAVIIGWENVFLWNISYERDVSSQAHSAEREREIAYFSLLSAEQQVTAKKEL